MKVLPHVHPSSIELFEHHEGIKDVEEDFVPVVTIQTIKTDTQPSADEIKSLPPPSTPYNSQHYERPDSRQPVVSSLPDRPKHFVPFVHHLHAPESEIPRLIFSPLKQGPKPILVEIGHQVVLSQQQADNDGNKAVDSFVKSLPDINHDESSVFPVHSGQNNNQNLPQHQQQSLVTNSSSAVKAVHTLQNIILTSQHQASQKPSQNILRGKLISNNVDGPPIETVDVISSTTNLQSDSEKPQSIENNINFEEIPKSTLQIDLGLVSDIEPIKKIKTPVLQPAKEATVQTFVNKSPNLKEKNAKTNVIFVSDVKDDVRSIQEPVSKLLEKNHETTFVNSKLFFSEDSTKFEDEDTVEIPVIIEGDVEKNVFDFKSGNQFRFEDHPASQRLKLKEDVKNSPNHGNTVSFMFTRFGEGNNATSFRLDLNNEFQENQEVNSHISRLQLTTPIPNVDVNILPQSHQSSTSSPFTSSSSANQENENLVIEGSKSVSRRPTGIPGFEIFKISPIFKNVNMVNGPKPPKPKGLPPTSSKPPKPKRLPSTSSKPSKPKRLPSTSSNLTKPKVFFPTSSKPPKPKRLPPVSSGPPKPKGLPPASSKQSKFLFPTTERVKFEDQPFVFIPPKPESHPTSVNDFGTKKVIIQQLPNNIRLPPSVHTDQEVNIPINITEVGSNSLVEHNVQHNVVPASFFPIKQSFNKPKTNNVPGSIRGSSDQAVFPLSSPFLFLRQQLAEVKQNIVLPAQAGNPFQTQPQFQKPKATTMSSVHDNQNKPRKTFFPVSSTTIRPNHHSKQLPHLQVSSPTKSSFRIKSKQSSFSPALQSVKTDDEKTTISLMIEETLGMDHVNLTSFGSKTNSSEEGKNISEKDESKIVVVPSFKSRHRNDSKLVNDTFEKKGENIFKQRQPIMKGHLELETLTENITDRLQKLRESLKKTKDSLENQRKSQISSASLPRKVTRKLVKSRKRIPGRNRQNQRLRLRSKIKENPRLVTKSRGNVSTEELIKPVEKSSSENINIEKELEKTYGKDVVQGLLGVLVKAVSHPDKDRILKQLKGQLSAMNLKDVKKLQFGEVSRPYSFTTTTTVTPTTTTTPPESSSSASNSKTSESIVEDEYTDVLEKQLERVENLVKKVKYHQSDSSTTKNDSLKKFFEESTRSSNLNKLFSTEHIKPKIKMSKTSFSDKTVNVLDGIPDGEPGLTSDFYERVPFLPDNVVPPFSQTPSKITEEVEDVAGSQINEKSSSLKLIRSKEESKHEEIKIQLVMRDMPDSAKIENDIKEALQSEEKEEVNKGKEEENNKEELLSTKLLPVSKPQLKKSEFLKLRKLFQLSNKHNTTKVGEILGKNML